MIGLAFLCHAQPTLALASAWAGANAPQVAYSFFDMLLCRPLGTMHSTMR